MSKWELDDDEQSETDDRIVFARAKTDREEVSDNAFWSFVGYLKKRQTKGLQEVSGFTAFLVILLSSLIIIYVTFLIVWGFILGIQNSFSARGTFYVGVLVLSGGVLYNLVRLFYRRRINKQKIK